MVTAALLAWIFQRRDAAPPAPRGTCVSLPADAAWSGELRPGEVVTCQVGVLWLTQTGDGRDHVLRVGQAFTAVRRGKVAVAALEGARFSVTRRRGRR